MAKRQWTEEQAFVIHAGTQTLLVNAGAGTGKTASLIERLLTLLDREPNDPDPHQRPASLQQIVVVTFTNAAAREMKERLAKGLRERVEFAQTTHQDTDRLRHLRSELSLLPRATISTLHSFCITLLRQYGSLIGLAPDFEILNEEESHILRNELLETRLEELAATTEGHAQLKALLQGISLSAGLTKLKQEIRSTHYFLEALSNPDEFILTSMAPYVEAADESIPLLETQAVRCLLDEVIPTLEEFESLLATPGNGLHRAELSNSMGNYFDKIQQLIPEVHHVKTTINNDGVVRDLRCLKPPNKPQERHAKTPSDFDLINRAVHIRDCYGKLNELTNKQDVSLEAVRLQTASHLAPLQTMLQTLGQEISNQFQAVCQQSNRLTFNHLERLTLQLLQENPAVSNQLRNTYQHVFVDEFQDISGLQGKLLEMIAQPCTPQPEAPGNLFAVGDVKQSIYGFRQADPQQFLDRLQAYKPFTPHAHGHPGARLDLVQNFRSIPPLLRNLNAIFQRLFSTKIGGIEFNETHAFVPGQPEPEALHSPTLEVVVLYDSSSADEDADDSNNSGDSGEPDEGDTDDFSPLNEGTLEADLDQAGKEARHVAGLIANLNRPFGEIALLLRSGRGYAAKLVSELRRAGIPFQTQEAIGFFAQQEVNDLLCLLHAINSPYRDTELIGLLRGPMFGWTADELVQLRLVNHKGRLANNLRQAATLAPSAPQASIQPRALRAINTLTHWQRTSIQESVSDFINRLYREGSLVECYAAMSNGEQRVRNLQYFQVRAAQYDKFSRRGLAGFLEFLESLLEEEKELGKPPVVTTDSNAVHLMTMHKSKGLEFPVVICPFLGKKFNLQSLSSRLLMDRSAGVGIRLSVNDDGAPQDGKIPLHQPLKNQIKTRFLSEELRLLYVAMTRAEERLILTGVKTKWQEKLEKKAPFTPTAPQELREQTEKANCFLDWVLLGIGNTPEFQQLTPEVQRSTQSKSGFTAEWKFLSEQLPETKTEKTAEETTPLIPAFTQELRQLVEWENRPKPPLLRAKISATEAKRERETLHHMYLPPATIAHQSTNLEPSAPQLTTSPQSSQVKAKATSQTTAQSAFAKARSANNQWIPPFAREPERLKAKRLSGSEKGKIVHRFLALLDLGALAKGATLQQEWERLQQNGFFQPEEKKALWFPALEAFFMEMEIGRLMLKYPTYVQRELAFTAAVPAQLFTESAPQNGSIHLQPQTPPQTHTPQAQTNQPAQPQDFLILQGMIDALIHVPQHITGSGPIIHLIDFKTDYWDGTAGHYDALVAAYTPQILLYQYGIEKSLNQKINDCTLYFISAEQPYKVKSPKTEAEWHAFLKQTLRESVSAV